MSPEEEQKLYEYKELLEKAITTGLTKHNKQLSNENRIAIALILLKEGANDDMESSVNGAITKLGSRLI